MLVYFDCRHIAVEAGEYIFEAAVTSEKEPLPTSCGKICGKMRIVRNLQKMKNFQVMLCWLFV